MTSPLRSPWTSILSGTLFNNPAAMVPDCGKAGGYFRSGGRLLLEAAMKRAQSTTAPRMALQAVRRAHQTQRCTFQEPRMNGRVDHALGAFRTASVILTGGPQQGTVMCHPAGECQGLYTTLGGDAAPRKQSTGRRSCRCFGN